MYTYVCIQLYRQREKDTHTSHARVYHNMCVLTYTCDMTHSYMRHDSFIYAT